MVESPRESERSFANADGMIEKFVKLASRRISTAQVDKVVDSMMNVEKLENVRKLVDVLTVKH